MLDNTNKSTSYLTFAEFGKIFLPKGDATDFEILDRSDDKIAKDLYDFYNKKIAIYSVAESLPFTTREPGYGNFTVALMRDPNGSANYLFIQLQQRMENERLLKAGIPTGNSTTRHYNHARFSLVTPEQIKGALMLGNAPYTSLLVHLEGEPRLKDYYSDDKYPRKSVLPRITRQDLVYQQMTVKGLDLGLEAGLTNLLYKYFNPLKKADAVAGNLLPAVVLVIPRLDIDTRLNLMQRAQAILLHTSGVITFTLDFISEHIFQFYFCTEDPPNWMFTKPIIIYERELRALSNDPEGYYQTFNNLDPARINNPIWAYYLSKPIPRKDAEKFASLLISENESLPEEFPLLLLKNLRSLRKDDVPRLIKRSFANSQIIDDILFNAPKILSHDPIRGPLYKVILKEALERSNGNLANYFHFHHQIEETDRATFDLLELFKQAVQASMPDSLDSAKADEQSDLFRDLILLSIKGQATFRVGTPVLEAVFARPGPVLYQAINGVVLQKNWNDKLTGELVDTIIRLPKIWTSATQRELEKVTRLQLPNMFVLRVINFLKDKKQLEKFESQTLDERCRFLRQLLDREPEVAGSLFDLFTDEVSFQLRNICLKVCFPASLENLRFSAWWLAELAVAGEKLFKADYQKLITQVKSAPPLKLEKRDDQMIYFILSGHAKDDTFSLLEACRLVKLGERYTSILEIWLGQKIAIPRDDIQALVEKLPSSNAVLAKIVIEQTFNDQTKEICSLPAGKALDWLRQTAQDNLRQVYRNQTGQDQLYPLLCEIFTPKTEFVLWAIAQDPSAYPVNLSWGEYGKKTQSLYKKFEGRGGGGEPANSFVELVNHLNNPHGQEAFHRYGLRRLAELIEMNGQMTSPIDVKELRLFLTYALGDEIDQKISDLARKVLIENRNLFLQQISTLKDDEVYSLHLFFERNEVEKEIFTAFTDVGWQRRGRKPPISSGGGGEPSDVLPRQHNFRPTSHIDERLSLSLEKGLYQVSQVDSDTAADIRSKIGIYIVIAIILIALIVIVVSPFLPKHFNGGHRPSGFKHAVEAIAWFFPLSQKTCLNLLIRHLKHNRNVHREMI